MRSEIHQALHREWFADQAFWTGVRPAMFSDDRRERTADDASAIATLLKLPPSASILDVCCGFGRFSLAFARMGYRMTAFDLCTPFLDELRRNAFAETLQVTAFREDVRKFFTPKRFDAAVILYTSFGYFENERDDIAAMTNVFQHVRPGGRVLIDIYSVHHIRKNLVEVHEEENFLSTKMRRINPFKTQWHSLWIDVEWAASNKQFAKTFKIGQRIYTKSGIQHLLSASGFHNIEIFGGYRGEIYDEHCESVIALAERPT
jgi:SAM-dependent methyltransferase